MKTNELRVGNWVFEGFEKQWEQNDFCRYNTDADGEISDEIEPIELTEEWLVDFGFRKFIESKNDYALDSSVGRFYWYDDDFIYLENNSIQMPVKCKYVHQLQNLHFTLTGQELEFN